MKRANERAISEQLRSRTDTGHLRIVAEDRGKFCVAHNLVRSKAQVNTFLNRN